MKTISSFELAEAVKYSHGSLVLAIAKCLIKWEIKVSVAVQFLNGRTEIGYVLDESLFKRVIQCLFTVLGIAVALEAWDTLAPPSTEEEME